MKQIDLPLMTMTTGLDNAMQALRKCNRGALLSEDEGTYHLFTAASIAAARAAGIETLAALKAHPKLPPVIVVGSAPRPAQRNPAARYRRAAPAGTRLTAKVQPGRGYVLTKIGGKSAFVGVTSKNDASVFVSAPAAYYCTRPVRPHSFSAGEVELGQLCPRDETYIIVAG